MTTMTSSFDLLNQVVPRTYPPWSSWEPFFRAFHLHGLLSRWMRFPLWLIMVPCCPTLDWKIFSESSSLTLSAAMKSLLHVILISRMGTRAEGYVPSCPHPCLSLGYTPTWAGAPWNISGWLSTPPFSPSHLTSSPRPIDRACFHTWTGWTDSIISL